MGKTLYALIVLVSTGSMFGLRQLVFVFYFYLFYFWSKAWLIDLDVSTIFPLCFEVKSLLEQSSFNDFVSSDFIGIKTVKSIPKVFMLIKLLWAFL